MKPTFNQLTFEKLKIDIGAEIGPYVAETASLENLSDMMQGHLLARLTAYVLARKVIEDTRTYTVEHPATWWQHLKLSVFPERFKRRWPVRYDKTEIKVHFKQYEVYPKAPLPEVPNTFGPAVTYQTLSDETYSAFRVSHDGGGQPVNNYRDKTDLAYLLGSIVARKSLEAGRFVTTEDDPGYLAPRVGPTEIRMVLDALEELGVNTSELVRKRGV